MDGATPTGNRRQDWLLDSLRVWEKNLLQLIGMPKLTRRVLVQLEELHPPFFTKDFAEIKQPELGHDYAGLEERMALHSA